MRGIQFLYEHLHGFSSQANQFSGLVHQHISKTVERDAKIAALPVANRATTITLKS